MASISIQISLNYAHGWRNLKLIILIIKECSKRTSNTDNKKSKLTSKPDITPTSDRPFNRIDLSKTHNI